MAPLGPGVGEDATAAQIADAVVATWHEIELVLSPIVGPRGVAALYQRSLHLTGAVHPWMADRHEGLQTEMDLPALRSLIAQQASAEAGAGGRALLQTLYRLLGSLVGPSLTERLLHAVWEHSLSGPPAQDSKP